MARRCRPSGFFRDRRLLSAVRTELGFAFESLQPLRYDAARLPGGPGRQAYVYRFICSVDGSKEAALTVRIDGAGRGDIQPQLLQVVLRRADDSLAWMPDPQTGAMRQVNWREELQALQTQRAQLQVRSSHVVVFARRCVAR